MPVIFKFRVELWSNRIVETIHFGPDLDLQPWINIEKLMIILCMQLRFHGAGSDPKTVKKVLRHLGSWRADPEPDGSSIQFTKIL